MFTETIAYEIGTYYSETTPLHTWKIADDQGVAAELYVSIETGEIMNVEVRTCRRGEGLARALYEAADRQITVYHAPASHRTPEGHAFAEAVGGDALPCTHGCC